MLLLHIWSFLVIVYGLVWKYIFLSMFFFLQICLFFAYNTFYLLGIHDLGKDSAHEN